MTSTVCDEIARSCSGPKQNVLRKIIGPNMDPINRRVSRSKDSSKTSLTKSVIKSRTLRWEEHFALAPPMLAVGK